jgi:hypothetical protein
LQHGSQDRAGGQTATDQLPISTAIDHLVGQLDRIVPAGTKVFVDPQYFDTAPGDAALYSKYAIASVRDRLLRQGAHLTDDRKDADVIVDTGAQSIDHDDLLIGLPSIPIPIPLAGTVSPPKIAFYEKDHQIGVAKVAIMAYARDGGMARWSLPVRRVKRGGSSCCSRGRTATFRRRSQRNSRQGRRP